MHFPMVISTCMTFDVAHDETHTWFALFRETNLLPSQMVDFFHFQADLDDRQRQFHEGRNVRKEESGTIDR